ncbi:1,4-dihydroxy-2-naphthoate prenyltransferase, partial [Streptococcus suis]
LSVCLEVVELQTKGASVWPMTLGILWSLYRYHAFNWFNSLLFIIAVLSFDLCTTAIHNRMDYPTAKDEISRPESTGIGTCA